MCEHEMYNYFETLSIVETLMIESGIREFCTIVCKGECCNRCYEGKAACHRNEGRRLACSIFLCHNLLNTIFTNCEYTAYTNASSEIKKVLRQNIDKNIFYTVHTKKIQNKFTIDRQIVSPLSIINVKSVKLKLNTLLHGDKN